MTSFNAQLRFESDVFSLEGSRPPSHRAINGPAISRIISDVIENNVGSGNVTVEYGSGTGGLGELVPAYEPRIHVEGQADAVAEHKRRRFGHKFLTCDLNALPIADDSVDAYIGLLVLDIVSDLDNVSKELYRSLKPGGKLIHFHDMIPSWIALVNEAKRNGMYLMPLQTPGYDDVTVTSVAQFNEEQRELLGTSGILKHVYCHSASEIEKDMQTSPHPSWLAKNAKEVVAKLPNDAVHQVGPYFYEQLWAVLVRNGFDVISDETRSERMLIDHNEHTNTVTNAFATGSNGYHWYSDKSIPDDKFLTNPDVRTVIAQKPLDAVS